MRKINIYFLLFALLSIVFFSACAKKEIVDACLEGQTYGFLGGLWHGIIAPIDFVIMLFNEKVTVFAQNNNGAWYTLGFLIGSGGWGILGSRGMRNKKRKSTE